VRLCIRVRPGAGRTVVGGRYGEGEDAALVVAVRERAIDGAATEAALRAVADAFGVPRARVRLVTGRAARTKVIELEAPEAAVTDRLRRLQDGPDTGGRF
jgi:uncharacterized protein YggU (UPF0235/DUF167 family)